MVSCTGISSGAATITTPVWVGLGNYTAFLSELFPTEVRYTGTSLAYQTASTLGAGFTPLLAADLMRRYHSVQPIMLAYLVAFAITAAAVLVAREGRHVDLSQV